MCLYDKNIHVVNSNFLDVFIHVLVLQWQLCKNKNQLHCCCIVHSIETLLILLLLFSLQTVSQRNVNLFVNIPDTPLSIEKLPLSRATVPLSSSVRGHSTLYLIHTAAFTLYTAHSMMYKYILCSTLTMSTAYIYCAPQLHKVQSQIAKEPESSKRSGKIYLLITRVTYDIKNAIHITKPILGNIHIKRKCCCEVVGRSKHRKF